MLDKLAIVTDSTADLSLSYYEKHHVEMVPLIVRFGDKAFKDWIEIGPRQFFERLGESEVLPKTSQPSVAQFIEVYEKLANRAEQIVSIHISSELSGTVQAAQMAGDLVDVPVTVIDTKSASLGTGLIVDAAVRARDAGLAAEEVIEKVRTVSEKSRIVFLVGTLKYLQLGGRIGKAQALVASMLNIKPILTLDNGIVAPYKKVKGISKARAEMKQFFIDNTTGKGKLHIAFAHASCPFELERLKEVFGMGGLRVSSIIESEIGSVIGTYVGPGAFAVAFYED